MERTDSSNQREEFHAEEQRYRSLFEGIPIGLYITTPDGQIIDANPALIHMLGYPSKEALLGTTAFDLYANPADRELERSLFDDDSLVRNYETQLRRLDGQLIWVRDTCFAVRDESGAIQCFEGSLQDITDEKAVKQKQSHMARHDPLTGVLNRYALAEVLEQEASRAQRYKHPIGFLMIDVNRFKEVNDRFGHAIGDKVLQLVGEVLSSSIRDTDYVVRYGGDEFLLLLLETNGEVQIVRNRILETMSSLNPEDFLVDVPITLSIGVAHWIPDSNVSMEFILSQADKSMYAEKRKQAPTETDAAS